MGRKLIMLVVLFKMHSEILCLSNAEKMYILHKYKNCRTKAELCFHCDWFALTPVGLRKSGIYKDTQCVYVEAPVVILPTPSCRVNCD